jgi:hypothetical protein
LGLTQTLTSPDTYYAFTDPETKFACIWQPDFVLEFETSAGQFDVVSTNECLEIYTFLDGEPVGRLQLRESQRYKLRQAISRIVPLPDEYQWSG